LLVRSSP